MRIISGKYKGRRITAPKKLPVRPTTDMAKEGLFNILNNRFYFDEIAVIDLFSGTGNISYEFASRGVGQITSIDGNHGCVKFIETTSQNLEMPIKAVMSDVLSFLQKTDLNANIIFADPPYDMGKDELEKIIAFVFEREILLPEGELIIEHAKKMDLSNSPQFLSKRKYGSSAFSFFINS
jgi:16S rRNA (guanine(966)-N(2))-methyltransferase RsmD